MSGAYPLPKLDSALSSILWSQTQRCQEHTQVRLCTVQHTMESDSLQSLVSCLPGNQIPSFHDYRESLYSEMFCVPWSEHTVYTVYMYHLCNGVFVLQTLRCPVHRRVSVDFECLPKVICINVIRGYQNRLQQTSTIQDSKFWGYTNLGYPVETCKLQ